MESTLKNMVLTLFVITLASAASLGFVYSLTKGPIEQAKSAKTMAALAQVLPEFDNNPAADTTTVFIDAMPIKVYTAKKDDAVVGYAIETMTKSGFSGEIKMMVGLKQDGEIINIEVLQHNETPGLGSKMADPGNVLLVSFVGKNPADLKMAVRKDGGDIDVITASTISSRAYTDAVERAYKAYQSVALGIEVDAKPVDPFVKVLPEHDNDAANDILELEKDGSEVKAYIARLGEETVGYAVETSADGYNGSIVMLVGFDPTGEIIDIHVTRHEETEGFGALISKDENPLIVSLKGHNPDSIRMSLRSDGGDVDAISASTITSSAYLEAVKTAFVAFKAIKEEESK